MSQDEIAKRFPEAVAFAREFRPADSGIRLLYAHSEHGEIGRLRGYTEAEIEEIKARANSA